MIYVYQGDDDFSASEALGKLMEAVGPEDMREANVAQLDARSFTIDKFGGAAMVAPSNENKSWRAHSKKAHSLMIT